VWGMRAGSTGRWSCINCRCWRGLHVAAAGVGVGADCRGCAGSSGADAAAVRAPDLLCALC